MKITNNDINKTISPNDDMWTYSPNMDNYLQCGRMGIEVINLALSLSGKLESDVKTILDLPCGYGRVMRHLKPSFPNAIVTGCDISKDGVDFCARTFGSEPLYSSVHPQDIALTKKYDLIWCGSLLTHLDEKYWDEFILFFNNVLADGGVFVFTTHGRAVVDEFIKYEKSVPTAIQALSGYRANGFGYHDYPNTKGYGNSLASISWVTEKILRYDNWKIVHCEEAGWCNRQDLIVVKKK